MNDVEKDSTQHKECWPEGWEVHVQQILPGNLFCPKLWICRTTVGVLARQLWQVIAVQHGVWEVCKLQVCRLMLETLTIIIIFKRAAIQEELTLLIAHHLKAQSTMR